MFNSGISLKRSVASRLLPYNEFLDRTNWTSKWCRTIKEARCPRFENRQELYRHLQKSVLKDEPIDYLEFGVADGGSMRAWCQINQHPGSRFFGFDCFTGLPEDWTSKHPKGTFNRDGVPPEIGD